MIISPAIVTALHPYLLTNADENGPLNLKIEDFQLNLIPSHCTLFKLLNKKNPY
jgi:hypothetical protein